MRNESKRSEKVFWRTYGSHDMTTLMKLLHPHCMTHTVYGDMLGAKDLIQAIERWCRAFFNLTVDILSVTSYENLTEVLWVMQAKHHDFLGAIAPTGCQIELPGVTLCHIVGAQIIETWGLPDMEALRIQLGREKKIWDATFSLVNLLS